MTRSRVVLPDPLGPSNATSSPALMDSETSSTAVNPPNRWVIPSRSRLWPARASVGTRAIATHSSRRRQVSGSQGSRVKRPPGATGRHPGVKFLGLSRMWAGWRRALVIVTPATVLRWQRRRFRDHWTPLSRRAIVGARRSTPKSALWLPSSEPDTVLAMDRALRAIIERRLAARRLDSPLIFHGGARSATSGSAGRRRARRLGSSGNCSTTSGGLRSGTWTAPASILPSR
jgi:hypothetical protein